MAQIRQELNILLSTLTATAGSSASSNEQAQLDSSFYDGTVNCYFEIEADTSVSITGTVSLRRVGTTTDDATISIPLLSTSLTLFRSSAFAMPAGISYFVFVTAPIGGNVIVKSARIVVIQSAFTNTRTMVEIGNSESFTALALTALASPKYWLYTAANWNGLGNVDWYVIMSSNSTKITATAELQVDNGSFASWTAVGSDVTTTSATPTVVGGAVFTPIDGRHYRITVKTSNSKSAVNVYNVAIRINQASPTLIEAQYLLANTKFAAGTALQTFLTKWDSTEWTGGSNTYKACFDAANASSSVIELDTAAGTQITGSSVSSPNNQGISGSLTMPANGNLDTKATTNNGDVYSARILVLVSISTTNTDPPFLPSTAIPLGYLPTIVYQ